MADFCQSYSAPDLGTFPQKGPKKVRLEKLVLRIVNQLGSEILTGSGSNVNEDLPLCTPRGGQRLGEKMLESEIGGLRAFEDRLLEVGSEEGERDQSTPVLSLG